MKVTEFNEKDNPEFWMIDSDGEFANSIRSYLSESGIPAEGVNSIINNAIKVLGYCPNPMFHEVHQKTGLVMGKVQSGKTSNFLALSALSFDNGYNINILFGGTKLNLVEQNSDRLHKVFAHFIENDSLVVLNTNTDGEILNEDSIKSFLKRGKKVIIVSLKRYDKIPLLTENIFKDSSLAKEPILIIDDEGDEYSLNTKVKKKDESKTYTALLDLKDKCKRHCFISVTATPQANLLISTVDKLSPDFGVLVHPGTGYCGLEEFHDTNSDYCIELEESNYYLLDDNTPEAFYDALSTFIIGSAITRVKKGKNAKYSMLINPSQKTDDLDSVSNKVRIIIKSWKTLASDVNDIAYESFKKIMQKGYDEFKKKGVNVVPFNKILKILPEVFEALFTQVIHHKNDASVNNKYFEYNIYIGGQKLGRGITING